MDDVKRYGALKYYLPKSIIKNYKVIINAKNFYHQPIYSEIKPYEDTRNLTTGQGEDYTTRCFLDYEYIKSHYQSIAVNLSRQKELDADTKAIQQIKIVGKFKDTDGVNADGTQSIFVLRILEKKSKKRD